MEALRGTAIYLSAGSGLPGEHDVRGSSGLDDTIAIGGPLEAGAYTCTREFASRLADLHIPAMIHLRPTGRHSWPYWADELSESWLTLATALGATA